MRKAIAEYDSMLILLSNDCHPLIETRFSGSIVIEMTSSNEHEDFPEVNMLIDIMGCLDAFYSKATVVVNPLESAIPMIQIDGHFPVIVYIKGKNGYSTLREYHEKVTKWHELGRLLYESRIRAIEIKRSKKGKIKELFEYYWPSKTLRELVRQHDSQRLILERGLKSPFI